MLAKDCDLTCSLARCLQPFYSCWLGLKAAAQEAQAKLATEHAGALETVAQEAAAKEAAALAALGDEHSAALAAAAAAYAEATEATASAHTAALEALASEKAAEKAAALAELEMEVYMQRCITCQFPLWLVAPVMDLPNENIN